ncbi:group XIIB secretory phospholipase A2-like protein [Paramacrobiotus metropolitanus]|uniref:group XIIB secretory phospholipase A2-like protein n=1 Tax=Paramacrobiotus metropolitanus TaxID=2943436 RepID=UPI0024462245|nr:group XIIB secretory phospholipase A2-like protein [Paramacrobiotus metropolitanus]
MADLVKGCCCAAIVFTLISPAFCFQQTSAEQSFGARTSSLWASLQSVTHHAKALWGYVDSLAKEDCEESVCSEDEFLETNREFTPVANGCGSFGYNVDKYIADGMKDCCNEHDLCFSKCGVKKHKCDEKFKKCLYDVCRDEDNLKTGRTVCQISAKMLYGATTLAGCSSFHAAQSSACTCQPRRKGQSRRYSREL